jgi:hypothetical protein
MISKMPDPDVQVPHGVYLPGRKKVKITFEWLAAKLGLLGAGKNKDAHITAIEVNYINNTLKLYIEDSSFHRAEGEPAQEVIPQHYE